MNVHDVVKRIRSLKEMNQPTEAYLESATDAEIRELAGYALDVIERRHWKEFESNGHNLGATQTGSAVVLAGSGVQRFPPKPVGNSGRLLPLPEWTRAEVEIHEQFVLRAGRTMLAVGRAYTELKNLMEPKDTVGKVWMQLKPATRDVLLRQAGVRRLSA